MPVPSDTDRRTRAAVALLVAAMLVGVLWLRVLAVFVCALGTHAVYTRLLRRLGAHAPPRVARAAAVVITVIVLALIVGGISEAVEMLAGPGGGLPALLDLLADTVDQVRSHLPQWISSHLPASTDDLQKSAGAWLRAHAQSLQRWGMNALRLGAHVFIGLVIGLLSAFEAQPRPTSPGAVAAARSMHHLQGAFAAVVSAQLRIAVVNTVLTALFVWVALPLAGVRLPLSLPLVALTFCASLVPIVGNLVSNAAILLVALTVGPLVAGAAFAFLIAIHKLEYFLNAHFVGRGTHVPASWLLAAMVGFEAAFGVAGLFAAPIACAWAFAELRDAGIVA
jgi:predicted PurR-regulated permease PerM